MEKSLDKLNASIARYIIGEQAGISVTGSKERVAAFCDAARHSKNLYEALNSENAQLSDILLLIQKKKDSAKRFKNVTGLSWRL
ncbi:MAG: hypothetical protein VX964_04885 [Verrucomicrobiota bacterium]|nr:hypothetical protein [Verrucomicrobiota bacterium]